MDGRRAVAGRVARVGSNQPAMAVPLSKVERPCSMICVKPWRLSNFSTIQAQAVCESDAVPSSPRLSFVPSSSEYADAIRAFNFNSCQRRSRPFIVIYMSARSTC